MHTNLDLGSSFINLNKQGFYSKVIDALDFLSEDLSLSYKVEDFQSGIDNYFFVFLDKAEKEYHVYYETYYGTANFVFYLDEKDNPYIVCKNNIFLKDVG